MRKKLIHLLSTLALALALPALLHAQDLAGNWQGTFEAGKGLRAVIKITKADGKLKGILYTVDQAGQALPLTKVALDGKTATFTIKTIELSYTGTMNPDGSAITGDATLNGQTHAFNLQRVTEEAMWPIPEPPKPMAADAKPKFDVITVKPSDPTRPGKLFTVQGRHILTINTNLYDLVSFAYGLNSKQIFGLPDWSSNDKFDLDGVPDVEGRPSADQFRMLIQDALAQRFAFKFHNEQRELSVFAITVAKDGPKLTVTQDKPADARNFLFRNLGDLRVTNSTMQDFCKGMSSAVMDRPMLDHTGLKDRYDFNLKWTPDDSQFAQFGPRPPQPATEDANAPPSLSTALREQLGLKLDSVKAPADVLVIDSVQKPSPN
jgi:uncharacterized protein (TIGR03435 family)